MSIAEILSKRYQFEEIVSFRKTYNLPSYQSDINSIDYFINKGDKNNRFRKRYDQALELAKEIREYYETINISSVYGEEIEAL